MAQKSAYVLIPINDRFLQINKEKNINNFLKINKLQHKMLVVEPYLDITNISRQSTNKNKQTTKKMYIFNNNIAKMVKETL